MKKNLKYVLVLILITPLLWGAGTGLALSGGGTRALAHIGVLKVLDEEGIKIDCISGTSVGALIASLYACGMSGEDIEKLILSIDWQEISNDGVQRNNKQIRFKQWQEGNNLSLRMENLLPILPEGIIPGNRIINKLFDLLWECGDEFNYDNLDIPLRIVSTDVIKGNSRVFSSGNLHESIFASLCFPTLIQPFHLDDTYYIDGGILMNLPVEPLLEMKSDYVIGVKTNSPLKESYDLISVIDILEQTAGVAITNNIDRSKNNCDLLLEPDLENVDMLQPTDLELIIAAGEEAARAALPQLKQLAKRKTERKKQVRIADHIFISEIEVEGNQFLDDEEVLSHLDIRTGKSFTRRQIKRAFARAFTSELFEIYYPVIKRTEKGYKLVVKVQERHRAFLKFNFAYNKEDNISLRLLLDYKNLLMPNSRVYGCLELADNNELCVDYIKYFGNDYGLYYHLFPYSKEIPLYTYDSNFMKIEKVQAIENGITSGLGIFFQRLLTVEFYGFIYDKNLYRDIGSEELDDLRFRSWGSGIKLYFETLDDLLFPMKGARLLSKFTVARSNNGETKDYRKSELKLELLHPITQWSSLHYKFSYGSYFDKEMPYDPFYLGGMDSFLSLKKYARSSSVYKINSISFRINPYKDLYVETVVNNLILGDIDSWEFGEDLEWAGGLILGYQFPVIPIRLGMAMDKEKELSFYANIGYSFDMFEFSRR